MNKTWWIIELHYTTSIIRHIWVVDDNLNAEAVVADFSRVIDFTNVMIIKATAIPTPQKWIKFDYVTELRSHE